MFLIVPLLAVLNNFWCHPEIEEADGNVGVEHHPRLIYRLLAGPRPKRA